ncbi:hypothetical protein ACFB49_46340 [Sphingomonas sp. DBB INV C78]|uniref:hypothetical protein n=1 Tax=Sphingomonas sp. DBB INV C78 TaxID=3349434 RepID=UPI0036D25F21
MRYNWDYLWKRYQEEAKRACEAECPELREAHAKLAEAFSAQLDIMSRNGSYHTTGQVIRRAAAR